MMPPNPRTDEEVREAGFLALRRELGPADALRFIRLYEPGAGDFTKERALLVGDPSLAELLEELEALRPEPQPQRVSGVRTAADVA
jgi:hypothetical protein